jgi:hypothetical protein
MAIGPDEIRLSEEQERHLRQYAHETGRSESEVIATALEEYFATRTPSGGSGENAYELARRIGMIGVAGDLPSDLSTNPSYFEGFGRE